MKQLENIRKALEQGDQWYTKYTLLSTLWNNAANKQSLYK